MRQEAIVTNVRDDGLAEVVVERQSLCGGNCSECSECKYENLMKSLVKNPIGAERGQRVYIDTPTKGVVKGALAIYVLPIVMLFIGYFVAAALTMSEGACIAFAFGGVLIGIVIAMVISRKMQSKDPTPAEIVNLIYEE